MTKEQIIELQKKENIIKKYNNTEKNEIIKAICLEIEQNNEMLEYLGKQDMASFTNKQIDLTKQIIEDTKENTKELLELKSILETKEEIILNKHQARLIGFSLDTYLIKNKTNYLAYSIKEDLKYYYGILAI